MLRVVMGWCVVALLVVGAAPGCGGALSSVSSSSDDGVGDDADDAANADGAFGFDVVKPDSPGPDGDNGGLPPCNGGACPSPAAVSGFVPPWIPPTVPQKGACTRAMIDAYYTDILSDSDAGGSQFGTNPAYQKCQNCLESPYTGSSWGPVVFSEETIEMNSAGCIAILDPSAVSCAKSVEALEECEHAACDPVCAARGNTGFDDWVTCSTAADSCGCGQWLEASDCEKSLAAAGGLAAPCVVGQTFEDFYYSIATVFCGP